MIERRFPNPEEQRAYEQAFRQGEREGRLLGIAIKKDLEVEELKSENENMTDINTTLARAVLNKNEQMKLDSKTGLLKYEAFVDAVQSKVNYLRRAGDVEQTHALLLLDLDNFKMINDLMGYIGADETCLKPTARIINSSIRPYADLAGRFGGEEFVVLLPQTDEEGAHIVADRIRSRINEISLMPAGSHQPDEHKDETNRLGISIGLATFGTGTPYGQVFDYANEALKQAKELDGKNQTVVWHSEE